MQWKGNGLCLYPTTKPLPHRPMTNMQLVLDLEENPWKQIIRTSYVDLLKHHFTTEAPIHGISLCGATALFENMVKAAFPYSKGTCFENNPLTFEEAQSNLPDGYEVKLEHYAGLDSNPVKSDWRWSDYCGAPIWGNQDLLYADEEKCYAVTYFIGGRGLKNGREAIIDLMLDLGSKQSRAEWLQEVKRCGEANDKNVIKSIVRHMTCQKDSTYFPHSIFLYHGGSNEKSPMVTLFFVQNEKYEVEKRKWSWKKPFGYDGINFINLIDVKHGKISLNEAMAEFNISIGKEVKIKRKGMVKGSPKALKAGAKMKVTKEFKFKMEQAIKEGKSVKSIAALKAAYTRKINEIEKSLS